MKHFIFAAPLAVLIFVVVADMTITTETLKTLLILAVFLIVVCVVLFGFMKSKRLF